MTGELYSANAHRDVPRLVPDVTLSTLWSVDRMLMPKHEACVPLQHGVTMFP